MKTALKTIQIAAICGFVFSSAASAASIALPASKRTFTQMDLDRDGKVTLQELTTATDKRFAYLDTDKNGSITRAEVDEWVKKAAERRAERLMRAMDTDKDGTISSGEITAAIGAAFTKADNDSDGSLSGEEALQYRPHGNKK